MRALFAAALILSLALNAAQAGDDAQQIRFLRDQSNRAIAAHDPAGVARFIDDEYQITTSTGAHYQETPEQDEKAWTEIFRAKPDVVYIRTPDVVDVSSYYDLAAERGNWVGRWSTPEGPVEVVGTYFAQWRKVGADWKIRAEVFVGLYCNGAGC